MPDTHPLEIPLTVLFTLTGRVKALLLFTVLSFNNLI